MKILSIVLVFTFSVFAFSKTKRELVKIENPGEFEYMHCFSKSASDTDLITHYVIDIRNEHMHSLYKVNAPKKQKATELSHLVLVDSALLPNSVAGFDVSWVSKKVDMIFKLTILDTDGTYLEGDLQVVNQIIPIRCYEVQNEATLNL